MGHSHGHAHAHAATGRILAFSIGLTGLFVIGEAAAGWWSHSLALMSDAGHNFADALALVFSAYAFAVARQPASRRRTWGSHRVGILAALANAASLVVIALLIFWEALQRLRQPEHVESGVMIGVAAVAVVLNALISIWLHKDAQHDLNLRSAYLHMLGDALAGVGVVIAGVLVAVTGEPVWDPIVSLIIGALILWSSWAILGEAVEVLLEATPAGVEMGAVEASIQAVEGVQNVHDLHVWSVASGLRACSCHIVVGEQSLRAGQQVLRAVAEALKRDFHICHTTVQVEVEGCEENDMYCTLRALHGGTGPGHTHDHGDEHGHTHTHA